MLDALNRSLVGWLKDGWRVHIDGIGYFDVSLTAPETRNPKDTKASSVKFKNVNFRADKELRYRVAELKAERSKAGSHSAHLSEIEIDMKLTEFFSENSILVRRDIEKICQMTRVTAGRCLKRLQEEKKLKNINTKQQPVYVPVPGHTGLHWNGSLFHPESLYHSGYSENGEAMKEIKTGNTHYK